jgi:hypothetical protein
MGESLTLTRRRARWLLPLLLLSVGLTTFAFVGTAAAEPVDWKGNGADNGFCNDVSQDPSVPQGQQSWLFILTSPDTGPWTLTTSFQNSTPGPVDGVQQGNGSVHFTVLTSAGDKLLSASATNGTDKSVLTVSHCGVNEQPPPTPPGPPGPPGEEGAGGAPSAPGAAQAGAAEAVRAPARFTG